MRRITVCWHGKSFCLPCLVRVPVERAVVASGEKNGIVICGCLLVGIYLTHGSGTSETADTTRSFRLPEQIYIS